MKLVQMWIGKPPAERIRKKMRQNQKRFPEYLLIASTNFLNAGNFMRWPDYARSVKDARVKKLLKKVLKVSDVIDIHRMFFLYQNPDYWYADCDCEVKEIYLTEPGNPYFGEYKNKCDSFLICANGCMEHFNRVITDILVRVRDLKETIFIATFHTVSKSRYIIPRECFDHG
jgi:hypothetical protein